MRKMWKRALAGVLTASMALSLAACGGSSSNGGSSADGSTTLEVLSHRHGVSSFGFPQEADHIRDVTKYVGDFSNECGLYQHVPRIKVSLTAILFPVTHLIHLLCRH